MATKISRKEALKEDIRNVLQELCDTKEEEPFYKIFSRECMNAKGAHKILILSKAQLQDLS